jgi:hypothetical protein
MDTGAGLFFLALCLCAYFAPTIIACSRGHKNLAPIVVVNVFLGWTFIGWVVALCWSFTSQAPAQTITIINEREVK